jgi:hypothetical protein
VRLSQYGRRMRRLAVVVLVLAVVLVAGGAVLDRIMHGRAEDALAAEVVDRVEVDGAYDVVIDGFPFLTQVLAGSLAEVRGEAQAVVVEGVPLRDVRVAVRDVTTSEPHVAQTVEVNATVPLATVEAALAEATPGGGIDVGAREGELVLGTEVLGLDVTLRVRPAAAGAEVALELTEVSIGGATVAAEDLPAPLADLLDEWRLAVPGLPDDIELTRLEVLDDGVRVRAEGADVDLSALGG